MRRAGDVRLLAQQVRSQLVQFVRIPVALFFTLLLPLLMLLLFNSLFAGDDAYVDTPAGRLPLQQFYVGSLAAFTAVSSTFTNLANTVPIRRQEGILKRWRGTPMRHWVYLGGYLGAAVVIAAVGVTIMIVVGVAFFGTQLEAAKLPALVVTFLVGVAAFSALGLAVTTIIHRAEAAPAVANAIILPLAFVSDIFVPLGTDAPRWLDVIGNIFPLKPFSQSMQAVFNPLVEAPGFEWGHLAVVAAWGVFGALVALRWFKWEPVADDARVDRRARGVAQASCASSPTPRSRRTPRRGTATTTFPVDTVLAMGELGLFGLPFPEEYGGGGGDFTDAVRRHRGARPGRPVDGHHARGRRRPRRQPDPRVRHRGAAGSAGCPTCAPAARSAAFGLTEPDAGSDAGGTRTRATLDDARAASG